MKKRTAVFGYTKGFQRRIAQAQQIAIAAGKMSAASGAQKALFDHAAKIVASVKAGHRERQRKLRQALAP